MPCLHIFMWKNVEFGLIELPLTGSSTVPTPDRSRKEPKLGRSRSWSRYIEVSSPALGQLKQYLYNSHNSYWIGSSKWIKSIFFHKNMTNPLFNMKPVLPVLRSRNFFKVGAGAWAETNSFGSATLLQRSDPYPIQPWNQKQKILLDLCKIRRWISG